MDILKTSIVHFKQLQSLTLIHAVLMSDFVLSEVLGTLPSSLANLTFTIRLVCHPAAHYSENSNCESRVPKKIYALENIFVTGSFFLIQHLLSSIDSPSLKSIEVYPDNDNAALHEIPLNVQAAESHQHWQWQWQSQVQSLLILMRAQLYAGVTRRIKIRNSQTAA